MAWSGGKDSSYCLHKVLHEGQYDVECLLTTVNDTFGRVSMHGVREELAEAQAAAIGIPLIKVRVSEGSNAEYESKMAEALVKHKTEGVEHVVFGDIFLEDLRQYREASLEKLGMKAVFPLWKMDTRFLVGDFIEQGFKSVICCTNDAFMGEEWLGREIDRSFLKQLPANVDPCGENGEYHSFCYEGPIFKRKLSFTIGEKVYRPLEIKTSDCSLPAGTTKGFWFCDLVKA